MSGLHRPRSSTSRHRAPAERATATPPGLPADPDDQTAAVDIPTAPADPAILTPTASTTAPVPRTRAGAAWVGLCAVALAAVVLIIFMLQNTRTVQINFLWMDGSLPLALALLIAGVGVGILTMLIGTARLTQLRRLARNRQERSHAGRSSAESVDTPTTE